MSQILHYMYTQRKHTEIERAHILKDGSFEKGADVETRCGLVYEYQPDFANTCSFDELPELVCRNCRRTL